MLVSRPFDSGRNTWSSRKFEDVFHNASSPRMSTFEGLTSQSDWRDQYSAFPLSTDNGLIHTSYEQSSTADIPPSTPVRTQSTSRPPLGVHRHTTGPLMQEQEPVPKIERSDSAPPGDGLGQQIDEREEETLGLVESATTLLVSSDAADSLNDVKDEDEDDEIDDDEMLEPEEGGAPQTAAERRAERRKMKRFRLTHQQTRFLMSEFAKQAHPDASHRERLSKEIPGLSPRQVQVWFQNRRAKIKRLTADDRDRMMKMRAVPDDFDNVQALHSPYGAVHAIGTPLQSPVDFMPSYAEHMMRPLMIDTMRRHEGDEQHMSPTGLSPAFGHIGFNAAGSVGSADVLSPLSMNSSDRFYGSQMSSPMSAGPRSSHFDRQNIYQGLPHSRQHVRPLQPLQLRETMSRNRAESLQSPLRSSMSWKGETLDYGNYQTGHASPQLSGRQQSMYQPEHAANGINTTQFDSGAFTATSSHSPPHLGFATTLGPSQSLQQTAPSTMSRLRSSSGSAFPAGLDIRTQFRTIHSQPNNGHLATPRSGSFSNAFSAGYPSAPLTAPVDFTLSRGNDASRDFNMPQLSAPMQASNDFAHAYNSSLKQNDHGDLTQHQHQEDQSQVQHQHTRSNEDNGFLRAPEFDISGHKRKRSFTMPGHFETA